MRPIAFYQLGRSLAVNASSEAEQRTAVSRLYYGLHHEACCRLFRRNPDSGPLDRNRSHTDLQNRYNQSEDAVSKGIGVLLNDLRVLREEADYELGPLRYRNNPLSLNQLVDTAIALGEQLLEELELYSPGEAEDGCRCPKAYVSR